MKEGGAGGEEGVLTSVQLLPPFFCFGFFHIRPWNRVASLRGKRREFLSEMPWQEFGNMTITTSAFQNRSEEFGLFTNLLQAPNYHPVMLTTIQVSTKPQVLHQFSSLLRNLTPDFTTPFRQELSTSLSEVQEEKIRQRQQRKKPEPVHSLATIY